MLATLRIRTLFLLLVTAVAMLTGALAWQLNDRLHEHSERASAIFTNNLVPLRAIKQMSDYYAVTVVDTIQKVRSGELAPDAAIEILARTNAEADLTWRYLSDVFRDADSTAVREIPPLLTDARRAAETAVSLLQQDRNEALERFASQALYRAIDPLTRRLNQMAEFNVGRATSEHKDLRDALISSRQLLIAGSLLLIMTGAVLALWLQRRIVSPLHAMHHHLKAMTTGDLRQRIDTGRIGELGNVMQALSELQTTLAQHREDIEQSNIRLNNILEGTEAGTWQWNVQTNEVIYNEQWAALLGRTLAELQPISVNTFTELTHPDDGVRVMKVVSDYCAGLSPNFESEIRMQHRDGHWVWILTRGRIMTRTSDGAPEWMFGTHTDISRQKAAFALVAKLAMVASHTSSAVVITDRHGAVEWINEAFTRTTGYTLTEVSGKRLGNVLAGPRTDRVELARAREQMQTGSPVNTELSAYTRAGKRFYLELQIQPVHDANNQLSNFVILLNDITERRDTEDRLRRQNDLLTHFNRGAGELLGSPESRVRQLLRATSQTLQVDSVSLWDYDERLQQLILRAKYDLQTDQFLTGAPLPTAQATAYLATLKKQRRIVSRNVWLDPSTTDLIEQNLVAPNVVALLDTALFRAGQLTGVLCLEHCYVERNWEHDEQVFVGSVVDLIQVWKEQDEVQQQQQLLEQTGSIANVGGWQLDVVSQHLTWSSQTRRIHEVDDNYTPTMDTAMAFYDPSSRDRLAQAIAAAMAHGTPWDFEGQLTTARGRKIWVRVSGAARTGDGKVLELYGAVQDISHQKEMERNLLATATLLSNVLSSASEVSIIATDPQGTILLFNRGAERMLGYTSEEMVGKQTPAIIHDRDEVMARAAELSAIAGEPISGFRTFVYLPERAGSEQRNWTYLRKDGSSLQVSLVVTTMCNTDGSISGYLGIAQDISEIDRAKQLLQRSESKFRTLFEGASDGYILMRDGTVFDCNNKALALFGAASKTEFLGLTPAQLSPQRQPDGRLSVDALTEHIGVALTNGIERFEWLHVTLGGLPFPAEVQLSPFDYEGSVAIHATVRDISDRKRAELALKAQKDHLTAVLDNVIDAVITIDAVGHVLSFNQSAERIFGYKASDVIGRNINMLMPEPYHSAHDGYLENYQRGKQARVVGQVRELEALRADGSRFPIELAVAELHSEKGSLFVGMVRDITERKRIDQMKNEFISTVSHELRTPLTSINGALKLVSSGVLGELPDRATQLLAIAQSNGDRLTTLINDLLDMEKVIAGKMAFHLQVLPVLPLIQTCLDSNSALESVYQVRFVLHAGDESPCIRVDELRFSQVLTNFLSNAAKFSTPDHEVSVRLLVLGSTVRITVHNHGKGIPASFRERIFSKFSQADSSDQRHIGGTGLGLAISKELTERMGGRIGFESEENHGAVFYVEFDQVSN